MAQHDFVINNQGFPAFRSDLNDFLNAVRTSHSGTSTPSGAVAGTIWLDTTSATTPTLKYYDGTDNISLATIDHVGNTVNWLDSTVSITGLTTTATGTVLTLTDSASTSTVNLIIDNQKEIRFRETTANGTNYVALKAPASVSADLTFTLPATDGTAGQVLTTNGSGVLSFATPASGISWQSSVKTSGFTAVAGEGYFCNTTSAGFTVTLPATPTAGQQVAVVDYAGTFDTNALVISPNGNKIEGATDNLQLSGEREGVLLVYIDSTQGWLATSGINEGTDALELLIYSVEMLIVAGGGAGGQSSGGGAGGGGAGGFRTSTQSFAIGSTYTITVGAGGAKGTTNSNTTTGQGGNGGDSSVSGSGITTITSTGGGGGGAGGANNTSGQAGKSGGSGGGTGMYGTNVGGAGNTPSTSPSQGNNGGHMIGQPYNGGGGGGGANAVGGNVTTNLDAGAGGNGTASSITGSSVTYAGGGSGGVTNPNPVKPIAGGTGGGGAGSIEAGANAVAGTANTGGGGGGGYGTSDQAGAGGSGVVILRMLATKYSGTTTGSPTVADDGSYKVLTYTGSGSYTA
jgi:hypothetical protein